jgi:hypothetical protein
VPPLPFCSSDVSPPYMCCSSAKSEINSTDSFPKQAAPVIADQIADPDERDVDQLNLPDAYFEVLDGAGKVTQRSKNLKSDLPLSLTKVGRLPVSTSFETVSMPDVGELRTAIIPFEIAGRCGHLPSALPRGTLAVRFRPSPLLPCCCSPSAWL